MSRNDFEQGILKAVADEGMNLSLLDGTKWNIKPQDTSTVLTWVPGATLRIAILIKESLYPYMLYHTGTGSSVRARKEQ
ncbi:MAG: hypothetical protein ABIN18_22805 [Pseudomonadota bacterium]